MAEELTLQQEQQEACDKATQYTRIEEQNNSAASEPLPTRRQGKPISPEEKAAIQATFLESFACMANVSVACEVAGVHRATIYRWLHDDESFAERWNEAEQKANDVLRREAWRRAVEGTSEYVISMGRMIKDDNGEPLTVKKYDTPLLMMLMRARMPEYREKSQMDLNATGNLNVNQVSAHHLTLDVRGMSQDELERLRQIALDMKAHEEQRGSSQ